MDRLAKAVTLVLTLGATHAAAAVTVANWTDQTSGSLNSTSFTTTGFSGFGDIQVGSYTGPDYAAAPAPIAEALQYGANSDWTVTFSSPLAELLVYIDFWRGDYFAGVTDPTSTYTFDRPFSILSDLVGASATGNTLELPDAGDFTFYHGILRFSGPLTSLTVGATAVNGFGQNVAFGVPTAVPEPGALALVCAGLAMLVAFQPGRSKSRAAARANHS